MANVPDNVSTMPVQLERLGSLLSNIKVEAGFSEAHRQYLRRTAPVAKDTTPVTEATSSWDSDSDAEIVATIHNNEDPWFFVEEHCVLLKTIWTTLSTILRKPARTILR